MGNCMKSKHVDSVVSPHKVSLQKNQVQPICSKQDEQFQEQGMIQRDQQLNRMDVQVNQSAQIIAADVPAIDNNNNSNKDGKPKRELSKIQQMKLEKKRQQQQQKQDSSYKALFDYLIDLSQQSKPQEVDMDRISQLVNDDSQINQCVLEKEFSGLTIVDYCFQNEQIYILRFLIQRVNLELLSRKGELANIIFKALISASKQFNKKPQFFFDFLDLIENSETLGELFSIYLETANPSCFLQCKLQLDLILIQGYLFKQIIVINLETEQAQLFLERVKELIQKSIQKVEHQKEIELLQTVIKIQHNFLLEQYFTKLNLPKNTTLLKKNLNEGNLKTEFSDRFFDLSQTKLYHKKHSLKEYCYNFAHHLTTIKRLDLVDHQWDIYMEQLLEKDSSRCSGASRVFLTQPQEVITEMIEAFQQHPRYQEQLLFVSNQNNQNLIHFIISNKNLSDEQVLTLLQLIFKNKNEIKENCLVHYDNDNNIPLTLYLKKYNQHKNLSLVEYLVPDALKNQSTQGYPLLDQLDFPQWEYQNLLLLSIPMYVWRVYPKLQEFSNKVEGLNNQIIISVLSLQNQSKQLMFNINCFINLFIHKKIGKEISDLIGNKLNFALLNEGYEQYLLKSEMKMAEKCLVDQEFLDEARQLILNSGQEQGIISYLYNQTYISQKKYFIKFIEKTLTCKKQPASALDIVVTAKLRQEFNQLTVKEDLLKEQLEKIFLRYENKLEYLQTLSQQKVFNTTINIPYFTFVKISALKDQKYFNLIEKNLDTTGITDLNNLRQQILLLNAQRLDHLAKFGDKQAISYLETQLFNMIAKDRVKLFRKFTNFIPFIIGKSIYSFFNRLNQEMKNEFLVILSEQFFQEECFLEKIDNNEEKQKIISLVISRSCFKKVLETKGVNKINPSFIPKNTGLFFKAVFETIKLKEKEQWDFFKLQVTEKYSKYGTSDSINLSQEKDIKYYQENSKRIIFGLINCDLLGKFKIIMPYNSLTSPLIRELNQKLKSGESPYLHLFYELMTTEKEIEEIILSHEKYFEILSQITLDQEYITHRLREYIPIAVHNYNLPAIKWLFTTLFHSNLPNDDPDQQIGLQYILYRMYPSYNQISQQFKQLTQEEVKLQRDTQWEMFKIISERFKDDIKQSKVVSKHILKLYEHFGFKFTPFKIQSEPSVLSDNYIHLVMIIREIYQIKGEIAINANKLVKQNYLESVQIELIIENYLKRIISWYDEVDQIYYQSQNKDSKKAIQIYYDRQEILTTIDFVQKRLFTQVIDSEKIQEKLLELSHKALLFNDKDLFVVISRMFAEIIRNNKDNYQCAQNFIDQVIYPYYLAINMNLEGRQSIQLPNKSDLDEEGQKLLESSEQSYIQKNSEIIKKNQKLQSITYYKSKKNIPKFSVDYSSKFCLSKINILQIESCLQSLIMGSIQSNNEELIIRLLRITSLVYYQSKSKISKFFKQFSLHVPQLLDFIFAFQQENPVFFNRYLNKQRFENIIKIFSEEKSRKYYNDELTQENSRRTTFIIYNLFKDAARFGQIQKWDNLLSVFKQQITHDSEVEVISSCLNAYAGRLTSQVDINKMGSKEQFQYNSLYNLIKSHMVNWLQIGNCVENVSEQSTPYSYTKIILSCQKLLKEHYQLKKDIIYLTKLNLISDGRHFSSFPLSVTLNILYLSLIFYFDDTLPLARYLHHKKIQEIVLDYSIPIDQESQSDDRQLWDHFIQKSLKFGALSNSSAWTNLQLRSFLDEFGEDYIAHVTSENDNEDEKSYILDEIALEQKEVVTLDNNFHGICTLNSSDSLVNQEYINFFIRNKDKLSFMNKLTIEFFLNNACRQSISYVKSTKEGSSENNYSKKYLLDAMKEFGIKLTNIISKGKYNIAYQSRIQKKNLELTQPIKNMDNVVNTRSNCLADYILILTEDELEHALSLGLFSLNDEVAPKRFGEKLKFLEPCREKETESMDDNVNDVPAIRYALMLGKIKFVKAHEQALMDSVRLTSLITNKAGRCAQFALLSGKLEIFEYFLNKMPNKAAQYHFIQEERILYSIAESFVGNDNIYKFLTQNFYCDENINTQFGSGHQLLQLQDLIEDDCLVLKHLAIMKQEDALLDIFTYILKHLTGEEQETLKEEMSKKLSLESKGKVELNTINVYDSINLFQLYNLQCFLFEKGYRPSCIEAEDDDSIDQIFTCNFSKAHQQLYLEQQGLYHDTKSRTELFTHLNIILKFLIQELNQYSVSYSSLQMVEESLFGFNYPIKNLKTIYKCLSYFAKIQFTQGLYVFCEVFKCINLHDFMQNQSQLRDQLQKSEIFNIYLLKHSLYPDIDILKVIEGNQQYFKNCRVAKFISRIKQESVQTSIQILNKAFQSYINSNDFDQNANLLEGENKYSELRTLVMKLYYQKEFIKIICEREREFLTTDEEIFNHIILQDVHLTIFLLQDNPHSEKIIKKFEKDITDNKDQYEIIQQDSLKKLKYKTKFSSQAAADSQSEYTDSPFNKVLRSLVYYFQVQKGVSIIDIYQKVFGSINIFSKQGISFQYHLLIIKNSPQHAIRGYQSEAIQDEINSTIKDQRQALITIDAVQKLVESIIYQQLIKANENFKCNAINIKFNNLFKDITKFATNETTFFEKQYALLFQTVFRFFQTIFSLHLLDNYLDKTLDISLESGNEPITITKMDQYGLHVNLYYSYSNTQFILNTSDIQPLIDQVENYYFYEKNMPFIEQQIELFNNHKDRLIPASQFGIIPFKFSYSDFIDLLLAQKKEILNQVQLRSADNLKNEFKKQMSQSSIPIDKKDQYFDSNTYFGLFSLVEDISMFLSFLNIKQKEFYALNDMFAPHNNAMMNPIEQQQHAQQSTIGAQHQMADPDQRNASQSMIESVPLLHQGSRIGGGGHGQQRENQNVLNSIKMQGAIFSYYLEQLPDNTYKVNLKKNSSMIKSPSNQLLFSEFYEFCPFRNGEIQITYIPIEEFKQKTQTQSIYNTLLAQVISYEQHFLCALKTIEDHQNLDCKWYYSIDTDKEGNQKIVYKKELFAGYNLLRIKQMMNDFENEISFGKREEISQKWKINVQSLLEVVVSGLFNIAQRSSEEDCDRCSIDRDSIFSLINYILSSPLLKKIVHIILYQNFSDSGNIMKVIKGIYFEFNEIEINDLPEECRHTELDSYLEYGLDQIIRIGKTEYYIHKFMLVIRINICFIKNDLRLVQINQNKKLSTEDLILREIPLLKNYIQIITNQYDFYEQIFTPEQIISFILNKLEIDNHLLSISKKLSKQFSQSQTIAFNINYESLYHIFKTDLLNAKLIKDPIEKIQKYDKIWRGLDNLRSYLLDQLERNLQQQLDKESYQDQFFMIFQNLIHSYENKQFIKKRLSSNYRSYPILKQLKEEEKQVKLTKAEDQNENDEELDDEDIIEEFTDSQDNTKIRKSQLIQSISQIRSGSHFDSLKNSFLIQVNINDFLLLAKKGDLCFVGYYVSNPNSTSSDYHCMMARISEKTDKNFTFESHLDYKGSQVVPQENIKFALMSFQNWPNPSIFSGQILKYCIIDSSLKIHLINSKALIDICQFFMSEESQNDQELFDQYQGYLYRGGDTLSQEISLNSLIQLMPSNVSFVFEASHDKYNDNQVDLLHLKKQQSSIIRNQFDMFDNNNKLVVFKFDENYKFKRPQLNPDQFSFASSVDSNQHIQEEYNSLIDSLKNLLTQTLMKESESNDLQIEFSYDSELEQQRDTHVEQIEMNIAFICYNIMDTFNQYVKGFSLSPEFIKQIYLLTYHDQKSRIEFLNESDIIQYLLVKLLVKHIHHIGVQFKLIPELNQEELPLVIYDDYTKSFNILVFVGENLDKIIIPSTLDIFYNLVKVLVNCELKYLFSSKYLSNKEEGTTQSYIINSDLKNFKLKFENDFKSFSNLHKGEYETLLIQLITLQFQLRNISMLCSLKQIEYTQLFVQFINKQNSSFSQKQKGNIKGVEILFGYGSINSVLDFVDTLSLLQQNNHDNRNILFTQTCTINIESLLSATLDSKLTINQYVNCQYSNEEQNQEIAQNSDYLIKMVDITNFNEVTSFNVESAVLENNIIKLQLQEELSHLKGKGYHFIYVVYFKNSAISFNYLVKNTDQMIQQLLRQPTDSNFKINQESIIIVQAQDPLKVSSSLFGGLNIQFSQSSDDNPISLSSYAQRYNEFIANKKIRLIKILPDQEKSTIVSLFTFNINSRYISKDILILTLNNSKAHTLNIQNNNSSNIIAHNSFSKDAQDAVVKIKYSSTSKIIIEKTQLIGCVVDDQPIQLFKSSKDKQKKDNKAKMSQLFQIFKPKTQRKLIATDELDFISSEKDLNKYKDIQQQVFMEDGRQSFYSRAGQTRKDIITLHDNFGNAIYPTETLSSYQVVFVHILFSQIKFESKLYEDNEKQLCCKWRPLIKGSYRMYINGIYLPLSEEIIGVISNTIDPKYIKIEKSDQQIISYYDIFDCHIYYKDIYGNNYSQFDKTNSKDPTYLDIKCNAQHSNLEFSFSNGQIDKVGKQKVILKFDSQPNGNLSEPNNSVIQFLYNSQQLFQFEIKVQGMNFEKRKKQFHEAIQKYKKNSGGQTIKINRDRFAEELLTNFENYDLKNGLYIQFKDEKGIDAGGLRREFYELIGKMMKDSSYQFFQLAVSQSTEKYYFHPNCLKMKQSVQYFKIFGKLIAHTILHDALLGIEFCEPLYKLITKQEIKFEDLKHVLDPQTFNNYNFLKSLDEDSLDDICQCFNVTEKGKVIELIPNGNHLQVTKDNLDNYLQHTAQFYLYQRFQAAITHLVEGFESVFPAELLLRFIHPNELSIFTCGLKEIDGAFLQKLTVFNGGNSILQSYYYRYLSESTTDMLHNFLKFITGSGSIPFDYSNFKLQIDFISSMNANKLPLSHTCFRSIEVPHYKSYEQMRNKFDLAFTLGSEGFAFG